MTSPSATLIEATRAFLDLRAELIVHFMRRSDQPVPRGEDPPLSAPQHLTLSVLIDGPRSVGEIAKRIGVSASTTTRMLQGLAKRRLIDDVPPPTGDRRRRYVTLTRKGRTAADARSRQLIDRVAEIIGDLDDEEITALLRGVRIFEDALKRNAAQRATDAQTSSSRSSSEKGTIGAAEHTSRSSR